VIKIAPGWQAGLVGLLLEVLLSKEYARTLSTVQRTYIGP
jgi:hypothetical protein